MGARLIRNIVWVIDDWRLCRDWTRAVTKVFNLIHIEPNAWKFNLLIKNFKHIHPIFGGIGMKIVNKCCISRPNKSNILLSSQIFYKNISLCAYLIRLRFNSHSSIYNGHIMILICYFFKLSQRIVLLINSKV